MKRKGLLVYILVIFGIVAFGVSVLASQRPHRPVENNSTPQVISQEVSPTAFPRIENDLTATPVVSQTVSGELRFSGVVTAVDRSCSHDGVCKIQVGKYWIITNLGGDPTVEISRARGPHGRIILADGTMTGGVSENMVGKSVQVYAKVIDSSTLSLYGNSEFFIRF